MKNWPVLILLLTGAVFLYGVWFSLQRRIAQGVAHPPYSTYRSDKMGTRRIFLFYEDAGLEPVRLKNELLMFEEKGLLFIIEPKMTFLPDMTGGPLKSGGTFIEQELEAIMKWVRAGNSLVLVSRMNTNLHEKLEITLSEEATPGESMKAQRIQLSPLTQSLESIQIKNLARLEFNHDSWVELFATERTDGAEPGIQVAVRKLGEGTVVVVADPYVFSNIGVLNPGNLGLAVRLAGLAGQGTIYFDEFHHGVSDPRTILSYLKLRNLHYVLFQVLAIFAFFIWRGRMRLGRPRLLEGGTERGSAEYVRAFSLIYRRAKLHGSVIKSAYELFRERVALWARLGRNSKPLEIVDAILAGNEKAAKRFRAITARAAAGPRAGDADVLAFIRAIAQFEKEYLNAGRRSRKTL